MPDNAILQLHLSVACRPPILALPKPLGSSVLQNFQLLCHYAKHSSAESTARASVGSMRKPSRKASPVFGTRATPTSRTRPSAESRLPTPARSGPSLRSVVSMVPTTRGGAVYRGPAVKLNYALQAGMGYRVDGDCRHRDWTWRGVNGPLSEKKDPPAQESPALPHPSLGLSCLRAAAAQWQCAAVAAAEFPR